MAPEVPEHGLVVVALPSENNPIQTVGSDEKHATLLYLGDDIDPAVFELVRASIEGFIRDHSITPFTESVLGVRSLGENGARVWMIDSDNGLRMLRDRLTRIPAIRSLYDEVAQYPNFTPHVTVGFPEEGQEFLSGIVEALARSVERIGFDRIALWYGDNHDCVYRLNYEDSVESIGHGDLKGGEYMAQSGILGQKWGVRRARGPEGTVTSNPSVKKAMESADAARAKASVTAIKKGGVKALSDDDLSHLTKRLNLEKKLSELDPGLLGKTNRKLTRALGYGDTMNAAIRFANSDAGRLLSQTMRSKSTGKHAKLVTLAK